MAPEGKGGKIPDPARNSRKYSFPMRVRPGGDPNVNDDWEFKWPIALSHHTLFHHMQTRGGRERDGAESCQEPQQLRAKFRKFLQAFLVSMICCMPQLKAPTANWTPAG